MPSTPNPLTAEQIRRNRQSRDAWDLYEPHRRQVTQLLLAAASGLEPKLCILGAGNANDVDLGRLAETYREVHLVDIDHQALAQLEQIACGRSNSAIFFEFVLL